MLRMISWTDLIKAILLFTGIYYAVVLLLFYRAEGLALVKGGWRLREGESLPGNSNGDPETGEGNFMDNMAIMMMAGDELKKVIKKVTDDGVEKKDMLRSITQVLRKYEQLEGTSFGACLIFLIAVELKASYSMEMKYEEIEDLWG